MATKKAPTKKAPTKKPGAAKAYHHGDLRRALLEAARIELQEVGRDELSLRSVARRAQVTHTSAYHHFKDKAALLATLAVEGFNALDLAMKTAMDAAGDDALQRLTAAGEGYLKMAAQDPVSYDLMFNASAVNRCIAVETVGGASFQRLLEAVVRIREERKTTIGDSLSDALLMWECVHGCAMLAFTGRLAEMGIDPEIHGRQMVRRLVALYS